jgi:hypothetical protein
MNTSLYRSTELADRIEALIASPPEEKESERASETRTFRFERIDGASHAPDVTR